VTIPRPNPVRWNPLRAFWPVRDPGSAGAVRPAGSPAGTTSMLPHRISPFQRPTMWAPTQHYQRQEFVATPPLLPGTAIPYTLFHPVYVPGLQGYQNVLPYNYGAQWQQTSFLRADTIGELAKRLVVRGNAFAPAAAPRPRSGRVWQQPRPDYTPVIINPGVR